MNALCPEAGAYAENRLFATLGEVLQADFLLHVIDVSHSSFEEQMQVVRETLKEIGVKHDHIIEVFNKIDALDMIESNAKSFRATLNNELRAAMSQRKNYYIEYRAAQTLSFPGLSTHHLCIGD